MNRESFPKSPGIERAVTLQSDSTIVSDSSRANLRKIGRKDQQPFALSRLIAVQQSNVIPLHIEHAFHSAYCLRTLGSNENQVKQDFLPPTHPSHWHARYDWSLPKTIQGQVVPLRPIQIGLR